MGLYESRVFLGSEDDLQRNEDQKNQNAECKTKHEDLVGIAEEPVFTG